MRETGNVAGGYAPVLVEELCRVWWLYRDGAIRLVDLRVWFACREMVCRRAAGRNLYGRYTVEELHRLIGVGEGTRLDASLRRLIRAGLLAWSEAAVRFPGAAVPAPAGLQSMLDQVENRRRRVPVPRRIVRLIAGGGRRAVIATILGHLFRCLYLRDGRCAADGRCKASWVADVFGVDVRTVKAARKHLAEIGWLVREYSPQWQQNRWGSLVRVNLAWSAGRPTDVPSTQSPPPTSPNATGSPPPDSDRYPRKGYKNQKPACRGPAGRLRRAEGREPTLHRVEPADLADTPRLLKLFTAAVGEGHVSDCEGDRLRFVAAAEHARAVGTTNPAGLFAAIVRRRLWHHAGQRAEDVARQRLAAHAEHPPARRERCDALVARVLSAWADRGCRFGGSATAVPGRAGVRYGPGVVGQPTAVVTHAQRTTW
jgi:hypothetical protein